MRHAPRIVAALIDAAIGVSFLLESGMIAVLVASAPDLPSIVRFYGIPYRRRRGSEQPAVLICGACC